VLRTRPQYPALWEGCGRKGIRRKLNWGGGMMEVGSSMVRMGLRDWRPAGLSTRLFLISDIAMIAADIA